MKTYLSLIFVFCVSVASGQKLASSKLIPMQTQIMALNISEQQYRAMNSLSNWSSNQPIGMLQFYEGESQPIYFEAYPNPAHDYLAIDFPAKSNVQFIRILDLSGRVVASYHQWDRLFNISFLQSGMYEIQVVQRNFMAHAQTFYKR